MTPEPIEAAPHPKTIPTTLLRRQPEQLILHTNSVIMAPGEIGSQRKRAAKKRGDNKKGGKGKKDEKKVTKAPNTKNQAKNAAPGKKKQQQSKAKKGPKSGKSDREKKEPLTAEELEKQMDEYWLKSKDKTVAAKKLDDDLDSYWAKKGQDQGKEGAKESDAKEGVAAEL